MIEIKRTLADNSDFIHLVEALDKDLAIRDGDEHAFFAQFNSISNLRYVVVAYDNGKAAGCGAIKEYAENIMEIKRMYVVPEKRRLGIASAVLKALENWAKEMGTAKCILETGKKQPEAIQLYKINNYTIIDNYGQYTGVENSICFEKWI
jgi:GNAT superfamily N-acetyltransferase